jgi:hypothetical protein
MENEEWKMENVNKGQGFAGASLQLVPSKMVAINKFQGTS